jgi:hypothetical protein
MSRKIAMFATAIRPSQALLTGSMVCQGRASKKNYIFRVYKPISVLSNVMTNVGVW